MARERTSSNSRLLAIGAGVLVVGIVLVLLVIRLNLGDDEPLQPTIEAGQEEISPEPTPEPTLISQEQLASTRLPLPLEIPAGREALAVRANFMRGVAAIPAPGDHVNLYRLPAASTDAADAAADGVAGDDEPAEPQSPPAELPPPGPDAELQLSDLEVLAVTGPLPASNDGELTLVLAVAPADIPSLMAIANRSELWFTLLPSSDADTEPEGTTTEDTP